MNAKDKLGTCFAQAEKRVQSIEVQIKEQSNRRIESLLATSASEQFSALDDPDLAPKDRIRLRRAVAADLRRVDLAAIAGGSSRIARRVRRIFQHRHRAAPTVILVFVASAFGLVAESYANSAQFVVANQELVLDWRLPSGSTTQSIVQAGQGLTVLKKFNGRILARTWIPGRGYATAAISSGN